MSNVLTVFLVIVNVIFLNYHLDEWAKHKRSLNMAGSIMAFTAIVLLVGGLAIG